MANNTAAYQPKVPISTYRSEFPNAKIIVAIGGWGDAGFSQAVVNDTSIKQFASSVHNMLQSTGADGIGEFHMHRTNPTTKLTIEQTSIGSTQAETELITNKSQTLRGLARLLHTLSYSQLSARRLEKTSFFPLPYLASRLT
jgi:hypothetical protein